MEKRVKNVKVFIYLKREKKKIKVGVVGKIKRKNEVGKTTLLFYLWI